MDTQQLELVLLKSEEVLEGKDLSLIKDLFVLRYLNEVFEKERQEIRQDFLLRGICSQEVDGLIDEPAYYKMIYLPKSARWNYLKQLEFTDDSYIRQTFQDIINKNKISVPPLNKKAEVKVNKFTMKQLFGLMEMYEIVSDDSEKRKETKQILEQWTKKNGLDFVILKVLFNRKFQ